MRFKYLQESSLLAELGTGQVLPAGTLRRHPRPLRTALPSGPDLSPLPPTPTWPPKVPLPQSPETSLFPRDLPLGALHAPVTATLTHADAVNCPT